MRGRLGEEAHDIKEIRLLNRIIRITPVGLMYEADPRHAELPAKSMNLGNCKHVATPGVNNGFVDDIMDQTVGEDYENVNLVGQMDERMPQVKFAEGPDETRHVIPYSQIYGIHPSKLSSMRTGQNKDFQNLMTQTVLFPEGRLRPGGESACRKMTSVILALRKVLQDGPAWGMSTAELISKISKKVFKPKRVGAKAAKAAEFESKEEVLSPSEATLFRALAPRANYLAMDRPEIAFATKELCRFSLRLQRQGWNNSSG